MSEIRDMGSLNISQTPYRSEVSKETQENAPQENQAPKDQVEIGKSDKSTLQKALHFPAKVIGTVAGVVVGAANGPLHTVPGAIKGMAESNSTRKGRGGQTLFNLTMWTQNLAIGAGTGLAIAGPFGAAVGAGIAALFTGVTSFVGYKSEAYDKMVGAVENEVGKAIEDNQGPKMKVFVQNATEGIMIGGATATKVGAKVGFEAGKGIVEGVFGAAEGIAEGIYEAAKTIVSDIKN